MRQAFPGMFYVLSQAPPDPVTGKFPSRDEVLEWLT
jgi:hypothetical protein